MKVQHFDSPFALHTLYLSRITEDPVLTKIN